MQKNETAFVPYSMHKKSTWNVKTKTTKLLEENTGVNLHDLQLDSGFLDMTPKAQATKENIYKLDFIKIKNLCASKAIINKVKRQATEWEKIFANESKEKGLISKIYK